MSDARTIHLKIKIKTLASEAGHIRHEARRTCGRERQDLNAHRRGPVRSAARHNQLAYAFLRGIPYRAVERRTQDPPSWSQVETLARRFGPARPWAPSWEAWLAAAQQHVRSQAEESCAA